MAGSEGGVHLENGFVGVVGVLLGASTPEASVMGSYSDGDGDGDADPAVALVVVVGEGVLLEDGRAGVCRFPVSG